VSLDYSTVVGPVGPVRGAKVVTITSGTDFEDTGFLVQGNGAAGTLVCTPLAAGSDDFTLTVTASQFPVFELAGVPVLCRRVRGTSTAASFIKVTL